MFAGDMFVGGGTGDFWGTVDSGHLVGVPVRGNTEIVARVEISLVCPSSAWRSICGISQPH
jgi:hypothetical protein